MRSFYLSKEAKISFTAFIFKESAGHFKIFSCKNEKIENLSHGDAFYAFVLEVK